MPLKNDGDAARYTSENASDIIDALAPLLAQQRQRWAAGCKAHGLSLVGFHVLALLEMHGAMPMTRLAEELDVALPNATGIINRMAERGIVGREQDPADRRIVRVVLADAGRQLIGEMEAGRRQRMTALIEQLDPSQQRRLLQSVKDLRTAARRLSHDEDAAPSSVPPSAAS